jgi:hypothetical protein
VFSCPRQRRAVSRRMRMAWLRLEPSRRVCRLRHFSHHRPNRNLSKIDSRSFTCQPPVTLELPRPALEWAKASLNRVLHQAVLVGLDSAIAHEGWSWHLEASQSQIAELRLALSGRGRSRIRSVD